MRRSTDSDSPATPTSSLIAQRRRLSIVVGALGAASILASAAVAYVRLFWLIRQYQEPDAIKATLVITATLFVLGAAALTAAARLHGD